jgi:hypothetical protein
LFKFLKRKIEKIYEEMLLGRANPDDETESKFYDSDYDVEDGDHDSIFEAIIAKELNDNDVYLEIVEKELLCSRYKGISSFWRRRGQSRNYTDQRKPKGPFCNSVLPNFYCFAPSM